MSPRTATKEPRTVRRRIRGVRCDICGHEPKKQDNSPVTRLPSGWHEHQGIWCVKCWPRSYVLRAISLPIVKPVEGTWDELGARLRECWRHATVVSNWTSTELCRLDITRMPDMKKLPALPGTIAASGNENVPIPTYLYRAARVALPEVAPRSLTSLLQRAMRNYRADRWDVIWTGNKSLRSYRYPQPYPCHNQAWSASYGPEGEPLVSVELGAGDRWTLQLARGQTFGRQLAAFRQLVNGDALKSEFAALRGRDGKIMAKLVMWVPKRDPRTQKRSGALIVRTVTDSFLAYHLEGGDRIQHLHADHVRRWMVEHSKRLERLADDTKAERRRPRLNVRGIQAQRDAWVTKHQARMDTWVHEVSAILAGYAERQGVEVVRYDDRARSYLVTAPYHRLREQIARKLTEREIAFEIEPAEKE